MKYKIQVNKLILINYYFQGESAPINFIGFKGQLNFYKNIKDGYITLEKVKENQKKIKLDINKIVKGRHKSEEQKSTTKNIKTLDILREKFIKLFSNYSKIASEVKYQTKYGEELKILTPKQMLQILPITLAQVKGVDTSENLLN